MTATPLRDLILLPKHVMTPPRRVNKSGEHLEFQFPLRVSHPGEFAVYVRKNLLLANNFSIGLRFDWIGWQTTMVGRVNGVHGTHANPDGTKVDGPHIHTWSPLDLAKPPNPKRQPKHATPLSQANVQLDVAWSTFCNYFNVVSVSQIDNLVKQIQGVTLSTVMFLP